MIVQFDKSFGKSIEKLKDKSVIPKVERIIDELENAKSLQDLTNIRKLRGYKTYFRARIGDYRIGLEKINESAIRLIIICHRKEIYNIFP